MSSKTNQILRLLEEGKTVKEIKEAGVASEALIYRVKAKYDAEEEKSKEPEKVPAEPQQGGSTVVDDNTVQSKEKTITLDKKGKRKKKEKIGEIRIVDYADIKDTKKEDTSDKVMNFLTDPKNQALLSTIGSLLQTLIAQKNPTPPVQKPKYGFDRDTGEPIDF